MIPIDLPFSKEDLEEVASKDRGGLSEPFQNRLDRRLNRTPDASSLCSEEGVAGPRKAERPRDHESRTGRTVCQPHLSGRPLTTADQS